MTLPGPPGTPSPSTGFGMSGGTLSSERGLRLDERGESEGATLDWRSAARRGPMYRWQ